MAGFAADSAGRREVTLPCNLSHFKEWHSDRLMHMQEAEAQQDQHNFSEFSVHIIRRERGRERGRERERERERKTEGERERERGKKRGRERARGTERDREREREREREWERERETDTKTKTPTAFLDGRRFSSRCWVELLRTSGKISNGLACPKLGGRHAVSKGTSPWQQKNILNLNERPSARMSKSIGSAGLVGQAGFTPQTLASPLFCNWHFWTHAQDAQLV